MNMLFKCMGLLTISLTQVIAFAGQPEESASAKSSGQTPKIFSSNPGDEWDYVSKDIFGKRDRFTVKVKAVSHGENVYEELHVKEKLPSEWVFDGKPTLAVVPVDSIMMLSPHWSGRDIHNIAILNPEKCLRLEYVSSCNVFSNKRAGAERITVPAGSFNTQKYELEVALNSFYGPGMLLLVVWYSPDQKRVIRQTIRGRHSFAEAWVNNVNETIELLAFRLNARSN